MALTRIENNQISNAVSGNSEVGINGNLKLQEYTVTGSRLANDLSYGSNLTVTGNTTSGNVLTGGLISATGSLTGGNIFTAGQVSATGNITGNYILGNITFANGFNSNTIFNGTSNVLIATANGNITMSVDGTPNVVVVTSTTLQTNNINTTGNATIGGDLVVNGNLVYVNVTDLNVEDPIIGLGRGANNAPLTVDDGKDRGEQLWYYAGSEKSAFTGYDNSAGKILLATDVTITNEIVTVNNLGNLVIGNLEGSSSSVTGTATAGNVLTGGVVSATGTGTFGNVATGGTVSATGTVTGGNVATGGTVSATGTATAGNVLTGGVVSATSTITGGNVLTGGVVSATGTGTFGNVATAGTVSATGTITSANTITGGNIETAGVVSATGTVTGGNVLTGGLISATGTITSANTITGANIDTAGVVSAAGNVTGGNILFGSGYVSGTGNVYANNFVGNISGNLTAPGANTDVVFNDGGVANATAGFTFNKTSNAVTVAGTVTGGNVATGGTVSATGTATLGNVLTGGIISATGAITSANTITGSNVLTGGIVSAGANITGGNVLTGGIISATSTITGGNVNTAGDVSATGSLTGGNIFTGGVVSAVSTVTGGNLATAGTITATGTATLGNVLTGGVVSATSNITGGNVLTGGLVSATGNVTGNYFIGNGSQLTGVVAANMDANLLTGNTLSANVTSSSLTSVGTLTSLSVSGTTTSGNLATGGTVSATSTITGGNIDTAGTVSATGTVTGGNIATGGTVSATGTITSANTITGGNVLTGGIISATGTITGGNVATGGTASATGNITGGNILTGGVVSATGNVSGNFFLGNGSQLTGIDTNLIKNGSSNVRILTANGNISMDVNATSNVVVVTSTGIDVTGTVSASGNVTGQNLFTGGNVSATGDVLANNVRTGNVISTGALSLTSGANANILIQPNGSGNIILANTYINGLQLTPQQDADAASKYYVDLLVSTAISYHEAVVAATTTALATATGGTITYAQPNGVSNGIGATLTTTGSFALIDTANVQTAGTRILVKNEANAAHNGIYVWSNATVITRSSDADTAGTGNAFALGLNDYFFVTNGNVNLGSAWIVDAPSGTITFGTSNISFAQFSQAQIYSANTSAGLSLIGQTFSAKVDNNTTAFDGGGNISVKAGANLTTPNIGAATGTSLSATGNITGGNILFGSGQVSGTGNVYAANFVGNISGNLTAPGANTEIVFNDNGVANATAGFTFNKTSNTVTVGGQITSTGAGNTATNGGQIFLNGATLNRIDYNTNGTGAPEYTTRSAGAKVVLYPSISGSATDYALGVEAGALWSGIPGNDGGQFFKWYGGNVPVASLSGTGIFSVAGTVTGANILTGGIISATGTATAGNVLTGGIISATGTIESANTITGGNLATGGTVSATGTATAGNVLTGGVVSATGTATAGNVLTGGIISATGTATAGNVLTGGVVSATGTITGGNVATGGTVSATGTATLGNVLTGGIISATGTITSANTITGGNVLTGGVVSAGGTGTFGNVLTGGIVSATSTITGGNILTAGDASAGGSLTGGNIFTGGTVSAVSTVTGGNLATAGTVSAGGTITGGNILTGGIVSASSNITGGNVLFGSGQVSGTGNVYAGNFIGNISGNLSAPGTNTEVIFNDNNVANATAGFTFNKTSNAVTIAGNITGANVFTGGEVSATGNVTGNFFIGNGSQLTGIDATSIQNGNSNVKVYANGNVAVSVAGSANTVVFTSSGVSATGNVSGNIILGTTAVFGSSFTPTLGATVTINATDSILLPTGNTVQRPTGVTGMVRFNTTNTVLEVYNGSSWVSVGEFTVIVDDQFAGDNSTITFVLSETATTDSVIVSINGVVQIPTTAYSVTGTNLTFTEAPLAGDDIDVRILTTTTTVTGISNSPGNASVAVNDTTNIVYVTGQLSVSGGIIGNTGINTTKITNGSSNVDVATAGGNVTVGVGGTSNVMVVSSTDVTVNGNLTVTGNATLSGNILGDRIQNGTTIIDIQSAGGNANIQIGGVANIAQFTTTSVVVGANILPTANITYDIGSTNQRFKDLWLSNSTIYLGSAQISANATSLIFTNPAGGQTVLAGATAGITAATVSASGNVTGGNILTAGLISATGNITGGNIIGNLITGGSGGGITGTGNISIVGNVTANNFTGTSLTVSTGNITAGNLLLSGAIIDSAQLDIQTSASNANIALAPNGTGIVTVSTGLSAVGNVSGGNLNVTGNIVDTGALSIITGSNGNITLSPNGTGVIIASKDILNGQANGVGNIGNATGYFNTVFAKATSAQYADLAEKYVADADYEPGTVVMFGGTAEVTLCVNDSCSRVAGVISTNPSYIMNGTLDADHVATVALTGRVPCRVTGTVRKGDLMVSAGNGTARAEENPAVGTVIGKALADHDGGAGTIEVVVGRF
jgi:hypothetical protein